MQTLLLPANSSPELPQLPTQLVAEWNQKIQQIQQQPLKLRKMSNKWPYYHTLDKLLLQHLTNLQACTNFNNDK
jgi:hypothetical protein